MLILDTCEQQFYFERKKAIYFPFYFLECDATSSIIIKLVMKVFRKAQSILHSNYQLQMFS